MSRLPRDEICKVYAIVDNRDGKYRWIGRTRKSLKERMWGHRFTTDGTMYHWLKEAGKNAEIILLDEGDIYDEERLIKQYAEEGHPLMNKVFLHGIPSKTRGKRREGVLRNRLCR